VFQKCECKRHLKLKFSEIQERDHTADSTVSPLFSRNFLLFSVMISASEPLRAFEHNSIFLTLCRNAREQRGRQCPL
jgi:hypothetical protein